MTESMTIWLILGGVLLVLIFYLIALYNNLVQYKNRYINAFSQIDIQLKRKYDLIPNLVKSISQSMEFEKSTLENVIKARNQAASALEIAGSQLDASALSQLSGAEQQLGAAMRQFNVTLEAYPQIASIAEVTNLNRELVSTENKIGFARQSYNDNATDYNVYRQSFPQLLFVGIFGHKTDASLLEFEDKAEFTKKLDIDFGS